MTRDTTHLAEDASTSASAVRFPGVYPAIVDDVLDPLGEARVRINLPWQQPGSGGPAGTWARVVALGAGPDRGVAFLPSVGDEVLVAFEAGDPGHPYVVGSLWSRAAPPPTLPADRPDATVTIRTASGAHITITDDGAGPQLVLRTPGGRAVELDDRDGGGVTVTDADHSRVHLGVQGVEVRSSSRVSIEAPQVEVTAGSVHLHSPTVRADGVLQARTLVVDHVVAASYTPGAGNIW